MPIDTHVRIAAWLNIVLSVLALLILLGVALVIGAFGAFSAHEGGHDGTFLGWMAGFGALVVVLIALLPAAELLGAVLLLRGSEAGRILTIVFSVLGLLNFPLGTAVGVYTLWAVLRTVPAADAPVVVVVQPASRTTV
jgi:hypothetical protein